MNKYIPAIILLFFNITVKAQQTTTIDFLASNQKITAKKNPLIISADYYKKDKADSDDNSKRAKRLKITGLVFTSLGGAGILTTTPFVIIYGVSDNYTNHHIGDFAAALVGIMGYTPSTACLITGIPMTVVGFKKSKQQNSYKEF
jgi:hypothetical protein